MTPRRANAGRKQGIFMAEQTNIIALLNSESPEEIREGAFAAGAGRHEEAVQLLVKHIQSANIGVQEAAERALRKIGGATVLHAVLPLLRSEDAPVRNIAMELLRNVSESDVPTLCDLLHDEDVDIRIFASDILGSSGSILAVGPLSNALLRDPEVNVRYQAAMSLGSLAFPEAAESLNRALQDEEWVQFSVIEALIKIRAESSINALLKALGHSSDLVASMIVDALGEMGNVKAVPLLIRQLDNAPSPLCNKIVKAVVNILGGSSLALLGSKEAERMRSYLLAAMSDEDAGIQDSAARGLASLGGEDASRAILELASGMNPDKDHERLMSTIELLAKAGPSAAIKGALFSGSDLETGIAVEALSRMDNPEIVPLLKEAFWQRGRDLQRSLIIELAGKAGPGDENFFLDVLGKHQDGSVLKAALLYLGRNGRPEVVGGSLLQLLDHRYDDVKEAALEACVALHDAGLNEHFRGMSTDENPVRRMMAIYALGHYDVDANEDFLSLALSDPDADVRKVAVESMGLKCPLPASRIQKMSPCLYDENRDVRLAAIDVLGTCAEESMTMCLYQGLKDEDPWIRARCAEKLGERRFERAAQELVELLHDPHELVAIKAVEALSEIGGEVAFRSLLPFVDHQSPEIQRAVEDALAKIRQEAGE